MIQPQNKDRLKKTIQIAIGIFCFYLIIKYFHSNQKELNILHKVDFRGNLVFFGLFLITHIIYGVQLFLILVSYQLNTITYLNWFKIFSISRFTNMHVLQGATIYRSVKLKKEYDFSYSKSIGMIAGITWLETITIFLILISLLAVIDIRLKINNLNLFALLSLCVFVIGLMPFLVDMAVKKIPTHNKYLDMLYSQINKIMDYVIHIPQNKTLSIKIMLLYILSFIFYALWMSFCFKTLNTDVQFIEVCLFTAVMLLSRTINIIPGNIGLRELLCGCLVETFGESLGSGIIVSALFRLTEYITLFLLTLIFAKTIFIKQGHSRV